MSGDLAWGLAEEAAHRRGHMALMGKARRKCYLACWHCRRHDQRAGIFNAAADDILMYGDAGTVAEQAFKAGQTDADHNSQVGKMKLSIEIGFDEVRDYSKLARRQLLLLRDFR